MGGWKTENALLISCHTHPPDDSLHRCCVCKSGTELLHVCFTLLENSFFWTGLHAGMVLALCHLCAESVNRAKIRRAGGLPLMLRIARNPSATSLRSFIFEALVQFLYDEASLKVRIILFRLSYC